MTGEEIKIIIDIHKALTNVTTTLQSLNSSTVNLVELMGEQTKDLSLMNQKADFLKDLYKGLASEVDNIQDKLDMLVRQMDYKELKEIKENKIEKMVKERMEEKEKEKEKEEKKKIDWKKIGEILLTFFDNSKWIFLMLILITIVVLVIANVLTWNAVVGWFAYWAKVQ